MNPDIERTAERLKAIVTAGGNKTVTPGAQHFETAWPMMLTVAQQRMKWYSLKCTQADRDDVVRVFRSRGFTVDATTNGADDMTLIVRW